MNGLNGDLLLEAAIALQGRQKTSPIPPEASRRTIRYGPNSKEKPSYNPVPNGTQEHSSIPYPKSAVHSSHQWKFFHLARRWHRWVNDYISLEN